MFTPFLLYCIAKVNGLYVYMTILIPIFHVTLVLFVNQVEHDYLIALSFLSPALYFDIIPTFRFTNIPIT